MICVENSLLRIQVQETGTDLQLIDKQRGQVWLHDLSTMKYFDALDKQPKSMEPISASADHSALEIRYRADSQVVIYQFQLNGDFLEVTLKSDGLEQPYNYPLPGSFKPAGKACSFVLPIMQGMYWNTKGEPFDTIYHENGHGGFDMAMFGCIGTYGALLHTAETADDCVWWVGKDDSGRCWSTNLQVPSLGHMRYDRKVNLYMVDPDITAVAKRYRQRVQQRGRFLSWEEKIKKRPALERLFGALMCFVGYCQDDIDYVEECRKLRDYGFDRVLLYPVRFNTYSKDFLMGGFKPIQLNHEIVEQIKELGYDVAPWSWINEGMDDHTETMAKRYRLNAQGSRVLGWQIDEQKWYTCCTGDMPEFQRKAVQGEFSDMTWDHFDVIATATNNECYALDHESHLGRPLSRTEDREFIRKLLVEGQANSRAVSSEGFNDAYSMEYDLGSVKAWPQYGAYDYWPIPLTMLVYHDSMLHTWWEPHNYNSRYFCRNMKKYQYGGGRARIMAAMDALYGCVPDVFAFGAMYGWTGKEKETFLYKMRMEDPETQFALSLAKPVAELHRKTGKLEMISFEFLSSDGYLQKTVFSDGTTVYANFAPEVSRQIEGVGSLQPESWIALSSEG